MAPTVFVSRPSILSPKQQQVAHNWIQWLGLQGFGAEALRRSQYEVDTWSQLRRLLSEMDGMLVLGFRQLVTESGVWRLGTPEEAVGQRILTSPWMQIETGMALMAGLPALAVCDRDVSEGVFARSKWIGNLTGTAMDSQPDPSVAEEWVARVIAAYRRRGRPARPGL
jgi:hypothetical protein